MGGYFPSVNLRSALVPLTEDALEGLEAVSPALAEGVRIGSREYKIMLDPGKFEGEAGPIVDQFWERELKKVIAKRLDPRRNGEARHKKSFSPDPERHVLFRDADGCLLNANGYLLRERIALDDGLRELTVKFRTPDIFLAAQSWIAGAEGKVKFEEDIAPLIRRTITAAGQQQAGFVQPPTMRSMFSHSVAQDIASDLAIGSLNDVTALLPEFDGALRKAGFDEQTLRAPLQSGERVRERVFSGARVDLGEDLDAEFDVSLWYAEEAEAPMVAELSFKYKTRKGTVAVAAARRALVLFQALQEMLGDWASPESETKTSLAMPESCRG